MASFHVLEQKANLFEEIHEACLKTFWIHIWFTTDVLIFIIGVVSNGILLWLFLRETKSLSASQVLGLNLVVMDFVYLSILPFDYAYGYIRASRDSNNTATPNETTPIRLAQNIFPMFNQIGCPLLLACMCIERYLAVVRPVLYLRARKTEYHVAVSIVVWVITMSFCVAAGVVNNPTIMSLPVSFIVSNLFVIMLASLGGVVWSLRQQSPAYTSSNASESPLKRRAVVNVLTVVVPSVVAYLPVCMTVPTLLAFISGSFKIHLVICNIVQVCELFPRLGVLIGPLFYLAKAKQIFCQGGTGKTNSATKNCT
uniref:P2Y purinoceptor 1-like n=1 Tax=Doryrhamphus excisus TaxID=161450 RepID=UPI0025AEABD7|nr:P2Y purinoceptor 1-like [Doryrhamphus excisus]